MENKIMKKLAVKIVGGVAENVIVVTDFIPDGYQVVDYPIGIGETLTEAETKHNEQLVREAAQAEINLLESEVTQRRIRGAQVDEAGGTAEGRAWMMHQSGLIAAERAKLAP